MRPLFLMFLIECDTAPLATYAQKKKDHYARSHQMCPTQVSSSSPPSSALHSSLD